MALTEREEIDKIEIVGPHRNLQVRIATIIERDGVEIGRSNRREVIAAGNVDPDGDFQPSDLTSKEALIQNLGPAAWDQETRAKIRLDGAIVRLAEVQARKAGFISDRATLVARVAEQQAIIDDPNATPAAKASAETRKAQIEGNIVLIDAKIVEAETREARVQGVIDTLSVV